MSYVRFSPISAKTINVQVGDGDELDAEAIREALAAQYENLLNRQDTGQPKVASAEINELTAINYPMSFEAWADIITDATDRMKCRMLPVPVRAESTSGFLRSDT